MEFSLIKMDVALWNGLNLLRIGPVVKVLKFDEDYLSFINAWVS